MQIAVIYLYYIPYRIEALQTFINSLQKSESGFKYNLYIIFKDGLDVRIVQLSKDWLKSINLNYTELNFIGGFDIDAYYYSASKVTEEYIICFNSNSKILHHNWLACFVNAITNNIGAVGATGSWQSYYEVIYKQAKQALNNTSSVQIKLAMAKLLLKSVLNYKHWFSKFPNPHLRTNAFLINRNLFLQLNINLPIKKKIEAYRFESGKNSLTNQLLKRGLQVCLVDKEGHSYLPPTWHLSNIFWRSMQEGLLIADNQTQLYTSADRDGREQLSAIAWGT